MIYDGEPQKAQSILNQLLELRRRNGMPMSATELYVLGYRAGNDPKAEFDASRMEIDYIRADASLAISKIGLSIEFEPQSADVEQRWNDAIDKVQRWISVIRSEPQIVSSPDTQVVVELASLS
jgi:hypothetical protein